MKFGNWFGVVLLGLGCSIAAHAQLGVYGTVTGSWFGGVTCPSYAAPCASNDGKVRPFGGSFGGYYDFHTWGPVRLGADLRGDILTTNKRADSSAGGRNIVREFDFLGGVRGSFKTPKRWLHPYAEIAGGYSRNNSSGLYTNTITINNTVVPPISTSILTYDPSAYTNYTVIKGFVGVDLNVLPYLDIRAIELGEGGAFGSTPTLETVTITNGTTGPRVVNTSSSDTHGISSIGAGIVIHFSTH
jgi:hypothetical protein